MKDEGGSQEMGVAGGTPPSSFILPPPALPPGLDRRTTLFLSVLCGLTVANLVLTQPLLAEIAVTFGVNAQEAGPVAAAAQGGYGAGILLLVPLGDTLERRRLILALLGAVAVALGLAAVSPGVGWLTAACFAIGFTTVVPQVLVPYAASLASPGDRARAIGSVQGALLFGILLSRSVAGAVAEVLGWRMVYGLAAVEMIVLAGCVWRFLPSSQAAPTGLGYFGLLRSMATLARREGRLRAASVSIGLVSGAFMLFWSALPFLMSSRAYGYGPAAAGAFGLVGAAGAALAPFMGRMSDRRGHFFTGAMGLGAALASFAAFRAGSVGGIVGLGAVVVGVLLVDVGLQCAHISNQAEIFSLNMAAAGRLNGVYMFMRFSGGAVGSTLGGWGWETGGWGRVCLVGALLCAGALGVHLWLLGRGRRDEVPTPHAVGLDAHSA